MAGALQGTGTPTGYPMPQLPWGVSTFAGQQPFAPQLGQIGSPFGAFVPPQLQPLQAAVQQLLQIQYVQQHHIQQLLQFVPQQLHQIQQLLQFVLQQTYQGGQWHGQPSLLPGGYALGSFGPSAWGTSQGLQPPLFGGQGGFGAQGGYVM